MGTFRTPFGMPPSSMAGGPEDLSRSAAAMQAALSNPALAAAFSASSAIGGGNGSSATKTLDLLNQQAAAHQFYAAAQSHKIHELQERAINLPVGQLQRSHC